MSIPGGNVTDIIQLPLEAVRGVIRDPMSILPTRWSLSSQSIVAALFIIFGVIFKNTSEQMPKNDSTPVLANMGIAMFVGGWALIAHAVSRNSSNVFRPLYSRLLPYVAAGTIVGAVMMMKATMKKYAGDSNAKNKKMMPLVLAFVAGWLLFAYSFNQGLGLTFLAAGLVFLSMLLMLPWQRKNNIVDGPGLPLFVFAWIALIMANNPEVARILIS